MTLYFIYGNLYTLHLCMGMGMGRYSKIHILFSKKVFLLILYQMKVSHYFTNAFHVGFKLHDKINVCFERKHPDHSKRKCLALHALIYVFNYPSFSLDWSEEWIVRYHKAKKYAKHNSIKIGGITECHFLAG